jgi:type I restriction enzyme S subunit
MSQEGRQQIITSAVSTSGLHTLSVGKISRFTLPKPDLKQQNEFVAFVEQLDKSKVALQKSITNFDDTIKSLLHKNLFKDGEKNDV